MRKNMKKALLLLIITLSLLACRFSGGAALPTTQPSTQTPFIVTVVVTQPAPGVSPTETPLPVDTPIPPTPTLPPRPTPTPTLAVQPGETLTPEKAKAIITVRADEVIQTLKAKDMDKLAGYVDPNKGVRFSPYASVQEGDRIYQAGSLKTALTDTHKILWGAYDGSGLPIELTFKDYYNKFVYDKDFAVALQVGYNQTLGKGNSIDNSLKFYPGSIVVEYYFPGFDPQYSGMDWESLRLVFQQQNGIWYLVGIVHSQWTI
jgi:hypothetical protein